MNSNTLILSLSAVSVFLASCKQPQPPAKSADRTTKIQAVHAAWHCPMHPQIVRDHPGNCPICGMELVPLESDATSVPDTFRHAGHDVKVDPAILQKIGVRTDLAQPGTLASELRVDAVGTLDEAAELSVTVRTMGYLETVAALRTGDRVKAGQVLATFYSPDLVAAQGEWLQSRAGGDSVAARAALERLRSYGLGESILNAAAQAGKPVRNVPLVSPANGWLSRRLASPGQSGMAGQELFRVVRGAGVLVDAKVPQSRLAGLVVGASAEVAGSDLPKPVMAKIRSILPNLDPSDRTATVRLEAQGNPFLRVSGLYQAVLSPKSETGLLVPDAAVLHSGRRDVVFLALGDGRFRPVEVATGPSAGGKTLLRGGIEAGDEVVVSAQFLLDGESRLQAALDQLQAGADGKAGK